MGGINFKDLSCGCHVNKSSQSSWFVLAILEGDLIRNIYTPFTLNEWKKNVFVVGCLVQLESIADNSNMSYLQNYHASFRNYLLLFFNY